MIEIDGEFFNDPVEELKKKKAAEMIILQTQIAVMQMQLHVMQYTHVIDRFETGGMVCQPNTKQSNVES
jgi:hypothetical protein